jgi:hypothetical protein
MTHAWKKTRGDLIKITAFEREIRCTPEHKILTVDEGYVEASALKCGDLILCKCETNYKNKEDKNVTAIAPGLNEDQLQIVYGSYFGDGEFRKVVSSRESI